MPPVDPPQLPGLAFERVLGSGGYADVLLYRQQLPERPVAVKVLRDAGLTEAARAQFTAEANAMAGLADHPNIVPVFSAGVAADGRPYLVMMYYPRANLAVRAANERLGVADVLRVGIQIASAVETAHRAGILHRDIKPANILTSQYGAPGLTDFGIAASVGAVEADDDAGVSVPWSAPEVLYATAPASVRSDVYSLAATVWHLLAGRSPFEVPGGDNSPFALMPRIRDAPTPPTGRADAPGMLDRLLQQAMAKVPAARPGSALEFARGLQSVEQALALPRTDVIVLAEPGGQAVTGPAAPSLAEPTRVQAPARVQAQPPGPAPAPPAPPAPPWGAPPAPAAPPMPPAPPEPDPARARRRTPYVLAGLAVVAAGGIVAGVLAAGGDGGSAAPTQLHDRGTQDAGIPGENLPPGVPKITAKRAGDGSVVFSWTYSAARETDTFAWQLADGSRHGTTGDPTLTLPDPSGARICVQVKVVRVDGSNASATWSPPGCSG